MKMTHKDALHMLGLNQSATIEEIKTAYRKACAKYHPDRNPAGLEMMKLINAAYQALSDYVAKQAEENENIEYGEQINDALNKIINLGLEIEICGSWIWVSGDTRPHKEILKEAGFKWAPKKMMWHFRPAEYKSFNRGKWDMSQIRAVHGSQVIRNRSYSQIEAVA